VEVKYLVEQGSEIVKESIQRFFLKSFLILPRYIVPTLKMVQVEWTHGSRKMLVYVHRW